MQATEVYLGLLRERGKRGLPLQRVYRQLFNRNLYLSAYGKVYRNAGALTPGTTDETADGMSLDTIDTIIEALRSERYHWHPARRVYIPKKSGKKRPLGVTTWSDKLLAEVIRMILSAYYDEQFSDHSHGFRPGRGCHTALQDIYLHWGGANWLIEGDISACFDKLDHELLLSTLSEKIQDGRFLNLMRKLLDAGYLEDWQFNQTLSGVPQGSIVSPVLSNILLNKLDQFVETVLMPQYTRGEERKPNLPYRRIVDRARYRFKKGQTEAALQLRKQAQKLPSIDTQDPDYRRLKYVRYADDFALAFTGPKAEAEEIKQHLKDFLRDELKLELSETKTLITHAKSEAAHFLGYEITTLQQDAIHTRTKTGQDKRSINGRIGLRVPRAVLLEKANRYKERNKPVHRPELRNESDYTIIMTYQLEYRGLVEYYRLAYNLHTLHYLKWVMGISLAKTLANKHQMSAKEVFKKYRADIDVDGKIYKGLQATVQREGKNPLIATWGGIPLTWDSKASINDRPQQKWNWRSELEKRLLAQSCEICEATHLTDKIEVHHIRALKDLKTYNGREKPLWVKKMAARRRKTLVLCRTCHTNLHAGRPLRHKVLRSRRGITP